MSLRAARLPNPLRVSPGDLARAQRWSIGQPVTVTKDDGSTIETHTRSAPFQGRDRTWGILVSAPGLSGCVVMLARVKER